MSAVDAPNREGAVISGLCENSVAAAAGLHVGDVVVTVNGYMIGGHRDCIEAIDGAADRVAFVLARPTREVCLDKAQGRIGITCTTSYGSGVLVSALEEGSLASRCGLFVGDTLLSVNGVLCDSVRRPSPPLRRDRPEAARAPSATISFCTPAQVLAFFSCAPRRPVRRPPRYPPDSPLPITLLPPSSFLLPLPLRPCPSAPLQHEQAIELIDAHPVVHLVVHANTREVLISRRHSGAASGVGLTVADRVDGGAGVVVIGLAPGGLAIRNLQLGDTILSVDGVLVSSHSDAISRIDASEVDFALVLGVPAQDLSQILSSVHQSTAAPARANSYPPCEPVFTRHAPIGAGPMREINGCSSDAGARF